MYICVGMCRTEESLCSPVSPYMYSCSSNEGVSASLLFSRPKLAAFTDGMVI